MFDQDDIRRRSGELAAFVRAAVAVYDLAGARLVTVGYSNGANIVSSVMLLHPLVINEAILLRPMVVVEPESPPELRGSSLLISAGASDPIVPPAHIARLEAIFLNAKALVEVRHQAASHSIVGADVSDSREWLQRLTRNDPGPRETISRP